MEWTGHKRWIGALITVMLACALGVPSPAEANVSSQEVKKAIQLAIRNLKARCNGGKWEARGYKGGNSALAVLALINAGVPVNDPVVQKGLKYIDSVENERTYVVSLKAQAYAAAGRGPRDKHLAATAKWLIKTQLNNGMWGYGMRRGRAFGRGDNSNTQFALLGLHEAAKAGVDVPKQVWVRSRKHFLNTQNRDGGWGYSGRMRSKAYGSMTTAGLASLYICGLRLHVSGRKVFVNGAYPGCGQYQQNRHVAKGIEWLTENFSVKKNPEHRGWLYYYLYGLERVGMIAGIQQFGKHDWYREGAAHLVKLQGNDGSWAGGGWGGRGRGQVYDTAFCLLFLAKGNRPVLFQKVRWKGIKKPSWNRNIHDLEHLTEHIGDKLGQRTTWQSVSLSQPLKELRVSPVLYVTGHEFPIFTVQEKKKLQDYVEAGGVLLFEACCGSDAFDKDFRNFARSLWGRKGYKLRPLEETHPVFRSYYDMKTTYSLEGINIGCRTSVFYSPKALSCLWELQDVKPWSDIAFRLGTNVAAYATGREQLANKLDVVELPNRNKGDKKSFEVPRGAIRLARLYHKGDYNADPRALVNLAGILRDRAKVTVVSKNRHLKATDEAIYEYPVLFMNGHYSYSLSDAEIKALRKYLEKGGTLIANPCCGQKAFDKSFRAMAKSLFPKNPLTPLKKDHPLYQGKIGVPLGELTYRKILQEELKKEGVANWRGTSRPQIESVTIDGRTAILYSRWDFCCALEGDHPYSSRGYTDEDGRKLALDLFLYALTY
jgi:hypothetical protein